MRINLTARHIHIEYIVCQMCVAYVMLVLEQLIIQLLYPFHNNLNIIFVYAANYSLKVKSACACRAVRCIN